MSFEVHLLALDQGGAEERGDALAGVIRGAGGGHQGVFELIVITLFYIVGAVRHRVVEPEKVGLIALFSDKFGGQFGEQAIEVDIVRKGGGFAPVRSHLLEVPGFEQKVDVSIDSLLAIRPTDHGSAE
ncbi:unnamed protein product [marine sediment metagenome]|uniref:Uncharacterized protein n=1 Tax=marine sediment metagenome TaxID=412755 RepID=X1A0R7_9ZZZZ